MLIDPADLARLDDLELAGRLIAQGYLLGRHQGRRLGPGMEFAQYRPYDPGEHAGQIDWRRFARDGRLLVRQSELEADFRVWLILDCSASMRMQSADGPLSKFRFASMLAAGLGYLAHRQNDELGLITVGEEPKLALMAQSDRTQWHRLLVQLDRLQATGSVEQSLRLPSNLLDATEGSLIVAISDYYQESTEWSSLLSRLAPGNRDLVAVCLECQDELELRYSGPTRFVDLETGRERLTDPDSVRDGYRERREAYLAQFASRMAASGIRFLRCNVDQPMDLAMHSILRQP